MKKISVVIATYNRAELLRSLLRDLAVQSLSPGDFEVIVVDDGSRPPTRPALATLELPCDLVILEQANAGAAAARHAGIQRASAEVVVIVDDDMALGPAFLAEHLRAHAEGNTLVLGRIVFEQRRDADTPLFERFHAGQLLSFQTAMHEGRLAPRGAYVCTGNVSFRRTAYLAVGGFDTSLDRAEDRELGVRLEKAGARLVYSHAASVTHRSDHTDLAEWFQRNYRYGFVDTRIAHKHPDVEMIDPWRYLFEVNPISRPLLLAAAFAPSAGLSLARAAMRVAEGVDRLGLTRLAIAGATLAYGLDYFRGVHDASGSIRGMTRDMTTYLGKRRSAAMSS
jgi:GT2 family glycosyltransferase